MEDPSGENQHASAPNKNRRVVVVCLSFLVVMTAITAYSPTLYRMFCAVTGYGGTTQRAEESSGKVLDRVFTVRFDSNVSPHLDWKFEPDVTKMDVKIGETGLAFFRATNLSDKTLTGQAGFNVAPQTMGLYFKKIECFCFTEQTLKPHQTVEMPVTFFIDPKMVKDPDTTQLPTVTLSYTFYPVENGASGASTAVAEPTTKKTGG
jgi:cytochrome c oxidase assembly protein subunit 11